MRAVTSGAALWVNAHHDVHPQLKAYLHGLLNARLGAVEAARRQAAWLGSRQAGSEPGDLARVHARGILAEMDRQAGNPAGALQVLETSPFFVDFGSGRVSAFFALARERYLRAELLHELGRDEEALGWYGGLGEIFPYDVVYVAPSHLRQAEIHERAGLRSEAAEHYERFIAMWEEADPELQPMVEDARRRLAALRSAG